jgi:hypothetical protein
VTATGGAIQAVQTAIYSTLSADATLAGLSLTQNVPVVFVYNDVPDGAGYPHVLISRATETPYHMHGGPSTGLGWKVIARVHTYSRYQGDREALNIHERIVTLLNFQTISVSGFSSATWELEQSRPLVEVIEKLETRHVVDEFCVMVQQ